MRASGADRWSYRKTYRRTFIRKALDESLRRLQTDYIDIYQLHNAKMEHIDDAAMWATLEELKAAGKIRMYGIALGPAIGFLYEGVDAVEKHNVASLQIIWNMLEQFPARSRSRPRMTVEPIRDS